MSPLFSKLGVDDTPVWMLWKNPDTGEHEPILVAWYNFEQYNERGFLTFEIFATKLEAEEYLKEFWRAYWRFGR